MKIFKILLSVLLVPGFAYGMATPTSADIAQQIEAIKKRYNITDEKSCQIAISKEAEMVGEGKPLEWSANHQVACMLAGYKDTYLTTFDLHKELENLDPDIRALVISKNIINYFEIASPWIKQGVKHGFEEIYPEINFVYFNNLAQNAEKFDPNLFLRKEGYFFTDKGQRNALLLAKRDLEQTLDQNLYNNMYLTGLLLGYKEADTLFFQQINPFLKWAKATYGRSFYTNEPREKISGINYAQWQEPVKELFRQYETIIWPSTDQAKNFAKTKKEAQTWLDNNASKSIDELKADIQALMQRLREPGLAIIQNVHNNSAKLLTMFQESQSFE